MGFVSVIKKYNATFWISNTIELFERWAWYGFYFLFANYLTGSIDAGGLGFTQIQKGMIMGLGTGMLYFLPVVTGTIADRYGYKKVLVIAFIIYTSAFILFPRFDTYTSVFMIYLYLALGAALFKPVISATIAKTTTDETASIGFGIFYMMVNLGSFIGPLFTLVYKDQSEMIFYISAGVIALNFILLPFYKEPGEVFEKDSGIITYFKIIVTLITSIFLFFSCFAIFITIWVLELPLFFIKYERLSYRWVALVNKIPYSFWKPSIGVFSNITSIFKDGKFLTFLLIVAGFWTMYNQLFMTLPVFIFQWVDTSSMYNFFAEYLPIISSIYGTAGGQMEAEFITNMDAMYIILFQLIVSTLVMKLKPLRSMMMGFLVCAIGMSLTLFTQNVVFTIVAILVFALGEMSGSPKITEYIGRIAPKDKKGLYMGYSFIPVFLGFILAGFVSGGVYQSMSDKTELVKIEAAAIDLNVPGGLTQNEYFNYVADSLKMTSHELTNYLWDKYNPSSIWYVIFAIGFTAFFTLFLYDRFLMKDK